MKKMYVLILTTVIVLSLTACGGEATAEDKETDVIEETTEEISSDENVEETSEAIVSEVTTSEAASGSEFEDEVAAAVDGVISVLWADLEQLSAEVDSYEKYKENIQSIEAFYAEILEQTRQLGIDLREYSLSYAEEVMSSDKPTDEKYDDLELIYDCIYDDAGDEIYDEIYDGILDEMYDIFYNGILDDAYDTVEYSEWSDAYSNEYERWSDTYSDVYEEWSDLSSDVYEFWSDMGSELWDDDIERAEKVMKDFAEDIEKLKGNAESNNSAEAESEEKTEIIEEETAEELVDGMRPEFKEAMDSYEAFYDEYCEFMKKYNENSSDLTLLAEYGDMLSRAADMEASFEEWDEAEMNDAELKYYLDVSNRVMQKMLDVM